MKNSDDKQMGIVLPKYPTLLTNSIHLCVFVLENNVFSNSSSLPEIDDLETFNNVYYNVICDIQSRISSRN